MDDRDLPATRPSPSGERLESWKEIAAHLKRGVSTVQRWEEQEGLPVHRHLHNKQGSVWAEPSEIDAWWRRRQARQEPSQEQVPSRERDRSPDPERSTEPAAAARIGPKVAAVAVGLVLLGGGALWAVLHRNRSESPQPLPVPLTSLEGREFDPALSPDGKELAFVWDGERGPDFALYVLPVGGDTPRRLSEAPGVCCPSWSPDGRSIAFVRQSGHGGALVVMPASGGPERTLTTLHPWFGTGLAWSPDGKRIAYPDRRSQNEPYSLVVLSLDTLEVLSVTRPRPSDLGDAFPSYSADGHSLAFARVSNLGDALPADVYVLRDGEVDPTRLTSQGGLVGGLDWAPGSRDVVYAAVLKGENPRLWRVSAQAGDAPSALEGPMPSETVAETTASVSHALRLSVARGTGKIAYVRRWYDTNIWSVRNSRSRKGGTMNSEDEGEAPPRRLIASTRPDESPQYSPDGQRIAFATTRSGAPEVWICRRDGTGCAPLTHGGVHSGTPRWSPDGRRIAIDSRPAGQSDIYLVAVESGEMTRVTSSPADDVVPSWSEDGRSLYFASNRTGSWQVYKTSLDGAETRQVSVHGGFAAFEGKDGVYFTKQDEPGLWRVPSSGGAESPVLDAPRCWGHWALGKDGVYLLDARPGAGTSLDFFDFAKGRRTTLRSMDQTAPCAESSLALSPDARELLYVAVEESSDIMMAKIR
jgi:Tol biopolymer transport system component